MKIVFLDDGAYAFASGASSAVGGSERDQWLLGTALATFGWSVKVGVRDGLKPGELRSINGVDFVGIGRGQILLEWYRFLASERPTWLFWECASHLWGPLVEIARFLGVRTIFHAAFDNDVRPRKALAWRRRWWPLYSWGLERTDRIFVQHGGQLCDLPLRWQSKACILPKVCVLQNVVDDKTNVKNHTERDRYVAWVGMLRYHKRPDILVEIAHQAPCIRFVVCGGVSNFGTPPGYGERVVDNLRKLRNVEFLGQVAPDKAQQVISDAALLFSTSDKEGFPNIFTQAWSSGTPVVSLKVDPDGIMARAGIGVVSGNAARAIADITALIDSPERRDEIAVRARDFILENHSPPRVVALFEEALRGFHSQSKIRCQ
jgi:glycosyltransferase involved in cell wall biosynthesis